MSRRIGLLLVFLFCVNALQAQRFAQNYWHDGLVILESGDTLQGKLKFDLENELVQLESRGTLQTLTSRKTLAFQFYDRYEQRDRYFYTLPYSKVSDYKTPTFFELAMQGDPISVLVRESLITQTFVNNNPYTVRAGVPITRTSIKYDLYFLDPDGDIVSYNGTKKGLLYLLRSRENDIKEFLKENRIRYDSKLDIIKVIQYYNSKKN